MKASKYNYFIPYKGKHLFFNGLSKCFFMVSDENHEEMENIVCHPEEYKDQYADFIKKITDAKFVTEDDANEEKEAQELFMKQRDTDTYKLMILPTYACNLSCWYCVQEHRNLRLSSHDVDLIKRHIRYYLENNKDVKRFLLSWFGGEPLLAFDIIMDISTFAQKICKKLKIKFSNTITTNGTLLTRQKLEALKTVDMSFFQITLDGCKEEHDMTKKLPNQSSYELILKNIKDLIEIIPQATCALRFNYTDKNVKPQQFIEEINARIPATLRKNITLSFKKVWQVDILSIDQDKMDELYELAKTNKYINDTSNNFAICYVEYRHYNTIFPNGRVDKCDNVDPRTARGEIMKDGQIKWKQELSYWEHTSFVEKESDCFHCKHLPVCNGPCPVERDRMWSDSGRITCRYEHPEEVCKERIIRYCEGFL